MEKANIEIGKLYSYEELCNATGVESKLNSGKGRELQLAKWEMLYEIEKPKRGKYIIKRIRDEDEIQYLDDLKNYSKYLTNLFIDILLEEKETCVCYTYRQIRELLGMVNKDYYPAKYGKRILTLKGEEYINKEVAKSKWLNISEQMDRQLIDYILNKLSDENRGAIINYHTTYMLYKFEKDKNGNEIFHAPHRASVEEESLILEAQKKALIIAGIKSKQELRFGASKEQQEKYYEVLNNFIKKMGYDRYAKAISITIINNLWKYAQVSKERFNKLQVQRCLTSKRFNSIPKFINEQLVDKLIKI